MAVDATGDIASAQDYYAYGDYLRSYNNAVANDKYKFTEKERDTESEYDYFPPGRYYDSEIGQWLQCDPLADKLPGLSPYNYTQNNPINRIDPSGVSDEDDEEEDPLQKLAALAKKLEKGLMDLLGLNSGAKLLSKTKEQVEQERVHNHGLSDQEQANVQFTAAETFVTTMAKGQLVATSTTLSLAGMGATGGAASALLGASALGPTLAGDWYNTQLTGNSGITSYSSFMTSSVLTGISVFTPNPIDKIIGAANIGVGIGTTSFEFEKGRWQLIKNSLNF